MITLIGMTNSIIGFGLCGVKDVHEVRTSTPLEDIIKLIHNAEHDVVMIDEELFKLVEDLIKTSKIIIKIPDRFKEKSDDQFVEKIMKDTIGASIKF